MPSQEELVPGPVIHKEKKRVNSNILITYTTISTMLMTEGIRYCVLAFQGIFSSVIKDFTSSKEKHAPLLEKKDPKESIRELSAIFSNANFACNDNVDKPTMDENQLELNIGKTMPQTCATLLLPTEHLLKTFGQER